MRGGERARKVAKLRKEARADEADKVDKLRKALLGRRLPRR